MVLARYQSSKLQVPFSGESGISVWRFSDMSAKRSGNCEIPDRLGFSRHMKTRLNENHKS